MRRGGRLCPPACSALAKTRVIANQCAGRCGDTYFPCMAPFCHASVGGGASPTPRPTRTAPRKNPVIARSAATWQSVPLMWCCAGEYGLPHQCAHWLAMTGFESAVVVGGGTHGCRPTGDKRGCGGQRRGVGDAAPYGRMARGCGACRRRGEGTPPYGCGTWGAVHAGRRGRRPLRRTR